MAEDEEEVWNRWADQYDDTVTLQHPMYARYTELLDAVVETAAISTGMDVLDIGTGTGNLAAKCLSRGAEVTAVDPSEAMLAVAQKKLNPTKGRGRLCLAHVADPFVHSGLPDRRFDAVVSTYAFHHVPRAAQPTAVREMFRILRPGGIWVIGDLAFQDEQDETEAMQRYKWLEAEHFALILDLRQHVRQLGAELHCQQFTPVTWLLWSQQRSDQGGWQE